MRCLLLLVAVCSPLTQPSLAEPRLSRSGNYSFEVPRAYQAVLQGQYKPALAKMTGRFYLDKPTYKLGEPVFLYFEATNAGPKPQSVIRINPYSPISGYTIHLSNDVQPTDSCPQISGGGSFAYSSQTLAPNAKLLEKILLNYEHPITAPGNYNVDARRNLTRGSNPDISFLDVRQQLRFSVEPDSQMDANDLKVWTDLVNSSGRQKSYDATFVLASLAPRSLEQTLLDIFQVQPFSPLAPMALHRLNTARSIAALATIVRVTEYGNPIGFESARYLAETQDPQWFPLLLDVAKKHPSDGFYMYPMAQSGGNLAVPVLLETIRSEKGMARQIAISSLAFTGSRAAIPPLLELLRNPDHETSERASSSLEYLTHRHQTPPTQSPQSPYPMWHAWWLQHAKTAHIYAPT